MAGGKRGNPGLRVSEFWLQAPFRLLFYINYICFAGSSFVLEDAAPTFPRDLLSQEFFGTVLNKARCSEWPWLALRTFWLLLARCGFYIYQLLRCDSSLPHWANTTITLRWFDQKLSFIE